MGKEHSQAIRDANFCLEEYLENLEETPGAFLVEDAEEDLDFEDLIP